MFVLASLRHRPIRLLWGGQVLSSIGDEIYRVALVWLAVGLVGADAGFLAAVQAASVFFFGLVGGVWADRWEHRRTMIYSDVIRAVVVLVPPLLSFFLPLSFWIFVPVAIALSSISAFFDPALQASLPEIVPPGAEGRELLSAANSLNDATRRLARVVGPGIVGALNGWLPPIHFFTLDALTFIFSAFSVSRLRRELPPAPPRAARKKLHALRESVLGVWPLIRPHGFLRYALLCKGVINGTWNLGFALGMALLVHERWPGDLGAFGLVMASYGAGNLAGNLIFGSIPIRHPGMMIFGGITILGVGFFGLALAPNLHVLMLVAGIMAIGGPMNDMPFLATLQDTFRGADLARTFRFRMTVENGFILATLLASPALFRLFSITTVITWCGIATLPFSVWGMWKYRRVTR